MPQRRRRRRNPLGELPYDEWIPTHAVMFNDDGSISLMAEAGDVDEYEPAENPGTWFPGPTKAEFLGQLHGFDYWKLDEEVYRSRPESGGYITERGMPSDVRWESSYAHFLHYIKPQMRNRGRRRNAHYGRKGELEFVPERLKADLMNLWHLSRTAEGSDELARMDWTVDEFHKEHPELTHSQIYRDLSAML